MYDTGDDTPQDVLYREPKILDSRCSASNGRESKLATTSLDSAPPHRLAIRNYQRRLKSICCIPSLVPWRALLPPCSLNLKGELWNTLMSWLASFRSVTRRISRHGSP